MEDMKDFLGSLEKSGKNPRNLVEDEAKACAVLIR